jgi:hypothetical protein
MFEERLDTGKERKDVIEVLRLLDPYVDKNGRVVFFVEALNVKYALLILFFYLFLQEFNSMWRF